MDIIKYILILGLAVISLPILSYLLVFCFYVVIAFSATLWTFVKGSYRGVKSRSFKVYWGLMWEWCHKSSWGLDQAASPLVKHIGNDILIKPNGVRISSPDKTLSYYLGKNKLDGNLYFFGLVVTGIIDFVALLFGDIDHTTKAANSNQFND